MSFSGFFFKADTIISCPLSRLLPWLVKGRSWTLVLEYNILILNLFVKDSTEHYTLSEGMSLFSVVRTVVRSRSELVPRMVVI